jgi:hypothetical protein
MVCRATAVAIASLFLLANAAQKPVAEDVRAKAADYLTKYFAAVSGVSFDEMLILVETTGGQMSVPYRLASDLVLMTTGENVVGLRDLYAIDTKPVREQKPRVVEALTMPGGPNVELVRRYVREHATYFRHNVVVWYSDPVLALQFGAAVNRDKLEFKIEGNKKMNGVAVVGLGFKERSEDTRILANVPGNARSSGRLWVDPATGAIHQTELWVQSQTDTIRVLVEYAPDARLGQLLPRKAAHSFEWREFGSNNSNSMASRIKLSFESNAEYKNPTHTPIK